MGRKSRKNGANKITQHSNKFTQNSSLNERISFEKRCRRLTFTVDPSRRHPSSRESTRSHPPRTTTAPRPSIPLPPVTAKPTGLHYHHRGPRHQIGDLISPTQLGGSRDYPKPTP
ncbi:hypothetical protein GQ607_002923 [Colletotrichum asianum]|uniref:Uncharacterized protein n=1 Tax=Colletotrichum asianum TaxID=702518 RepID=A0A8H3WND0_9PEZI|nr:hypothetical protein GQ607_002923 [Colletotrichum asianum]